MSVLTSLVGFLNGAMQNPRGRETYDETSKGAYWCHDCNEHVLDVAVSGEGTPSCPSCGDEMEFEREIGSAACAC